jgi:hypothetical protein
LASEVHPLEFFLEVAAEVEVTECQVRETGRMGQYGESQLFSFVKRQSRIMKFRIADMQPVAYA